MFMFLNWFLNNRNVSQPTKKVKIILNEQKVIFVPQQNDNPIVVKVEWKEK